PVNLPWTFPPHGRSHKPMKGSCPSGRGEWAGQGQPLPLLRNASARQERGKGAPARRSTAPAGTATHPAEAACPSLALQPPAETKSRQRGDPLSQLPKLSDGKIGNLEN